MEFKKKYLPLSQPLHISDIETMGSLYDEYICGSDQIWTLRSEKATEYYYLGFTEDKKRRIAYAPCIGDYTIPANELQYVKKQLMRFDGISMRDVQGSELIFSIIGKNVPIVVDPVLLKTKEEWIHDFALCKTNDKYLLCYILGIHDWYSDYVYRISKYLDLKVRWIPVNPEQVGFLHGDSSPCGPKEFLEMFFNATYILTDSFHGTLFSLIFEKQFTVLKRYEDGYDSQNNRIYSIFSQFEIKKKMFGADEIWDYHEEELDFTLTSAIIESKRKESINYLSKML